ncbi:MAG: hypothetical protein A2X08_15150 [Bacteroidetes bacterium GWA2_32_17]|nr:MAG: hypothetical protein A2X08_15150 [Bacteroidetes bacterium GWA2_32_17]
MKLINFFSNCIWKLKAIQRAKELNSLKKRIKELVISRDKLNDPEQIKYLQEYFETKTLERIKTKLSWVKNYSELIKELSEINQSIKEVEKELKHNGLSKLSFKKCEKILEKLESKNGRKLKEQLILKINQQIQLLPDTNTILFSSDILESIFEKYKNRVSENPMASLTPLILAIAAFNSNLDEKSVKHIMETVKIADIKKWSKENIGMSLFTKRKVLLAA